MKNTCLVVADGTRARLFFVVPGDTPRRKLRLVEQTTLVNGETHARAKNGAGHGKSERNTNRQAGPVHPVGVQRERHRLDYERRFGIEIVERAVEMTARWSEGVIVLIAEPRLLGLMRERMRNALRSELKLVELARNYSGLTIPALERVVMSQRLAQ